jgi:hypothetical protein
MDLHPPWIGLAALVAMFVLPFLPTWLFEGPRTIRHWPRRHVCGLCGAPWVDGHSCLPEAADDGPPLRGELRRLEPSDANAARNQIVGRGSG